MFENTKWVIRIRKSKKPRQLNSQKKKRQKDKQRSTKHYSDKEEDEATRTPLNPGMNTGAPEGLAVPVPHVAPDVSLLLQTQ